VIQGCFAILPDMAESVSQTLASRYQLLRPLGTGGMGTVWLARDTVLDREVAVKELRLTDGLSEAERAELMARVMREAEVTARLRHPGIVALHDVLIEGGRPWLVMELLHGRDLAREIAANGPMPPHVVAGIGARVLEALSAAHAIGVEHRDVKPGNVFLTTDGRVVLTDFGIARPADGPVLTEAGALIGSPGFIAPERLAGRPGGPAADLWSLGATLYTAVEGVAPYQHCRSPAEAIRATLAGSARPPLLAGPLAPLLAWLMSPDPQHRPDAATALELLRRIARGETPDIRPGHGPAQTGRRWPRWLIPVAAVAAAGAVAGAALLLNRPDPEPAARPRPISPTFTAQVDLCGTLAGAEVARYLGVPSPPQGQRRDTGCAWTVTGAGIDLTAETDSDTPDPWSLTPESARSLMSGLRRQYGAGPREGHWIWYEIGVNRNVEVVRTDARDVADLADEAFSSDIMTPDGRPQATEVIFRLGDLVVRLQYADLDAASLDDVRSQAISAAQAVADRLRGMARP